MLWLGNCGKELRRRWVCVLERRESFSFGIFAWSSDIGIDIWEGMTYDHDLDLHSE